MNKFEHTTHGTASCHEFILPLDQWYKRARCSAIPRDDPSVKQQWYEPFDASGFTHHRLYKTSQKSWLGTVVLVFVYSSCCFFHWRDGLAQSWPIPKWFLLWRKLRENSTALLAEQLSDAKQARLRIEGPSSRVHVSWHCIDMVWVTQPWWTLPKSEHMLHNGQAIRM